ncbi:DUF4149 domain-containing protein [Herbivorax sp. ANBcel31]|uniref:DUF4149 domain-containing protein n=1 Tax=Herbivorax sp. ANBcel31 TaxID=3069754 RepID=UPI0027B504F0|nr:DUF4149 domain-containing protein [Herbivorax sp. ANBcel31]MDQ2086595.1 DUF4149 domain-containing protein [Herbivorax sp. ANBcel31]
MRMRINVLIAFFVSLVVGGIIFSILGRSFSVYLGISLVFSGILLALFIFYKKISFINKLPAQITLIVLSAVVYLVMTFGIVIFAINYPPKEDYVEKMELITITKEHHRNGEELFELLTEFNEVFHSLNVEVSEDELDEYAIGFLEDTDDERNSISNFLKSNDIAISTRPRIELEDSSFSQQENEAFVDAVINFIELELVEVKILQNEGQGRDAANKYIDLWKTVDAILSIKNTNYNYSLLYSYIIQQMGSYYYNNQAELNEYNFARISNITENIIEKLDNTYKNMVVADYYILKANKAEVSETLNWPFFDKNRTLKKYHSFFYSMIEKIDRPYDETITYEEPIEDVGVFTRNPMGEIQYAEEIQMFEAVLFDEIISNYTNRKTELGVYMYAINYKRNPENIPKDYKTGGEVQIREYDDVIEVFTGGADSRERKFEILK